MQTQMQDAEASSESDHESSTVFHSRVADSLAFPSTVDTHENNRLQKDRMFNPEFKDAKLISLLRKTRGLNLLYECERTKNAKLETRVAQLEKTTFESAIPLASMISQATIDQPCVSRLKKGASLQLKYESSRLSAVKLQADLHKLRRMFVSETGYEPNVRVLFSVECVVAGSALRRLERQKPGDCCVEKQIGNGRFEAEKQCLRCMCWTY